MRARVSNPASSTDGQACSAASLWLVMMKSYRSMQVFVEGTLASRNIGLSDFMILEALLHKGAMGMSTLGEKVMLANPSMTAAVARLERLGYVRRESGTADRRVRTVALTSEGRRMIQKVFLQHERDLESVMTDVPALEREQVRHVLKCIGLSAKAKAGLASERPPECTDHSGPA